MGVMPNTPAEKGGIRRGDVIVAVNGEKVSNAGQLQSIVEKSGIDRNLQFQIQRGDRNMQLTVRTAQLEGIS